ncbi:OmpW family outer membrane protein [Aquabacterium sp.]|jgi:outer membrane protein W|uniref:OmpW/AlkL family protein n=1 Tax=Aquabacterium sp. TaxID=1872578 RepID=UPI0024885EBF|nr:OmpW family outer membrane protein [Aquabacterium sp.]MDI1348532.1 hypothetical protein [Aquabacterium sp.]
MHFSYDRVAGVRRVATLLLAAAGACAALPSFAQQLPNSIFPAGWDSKVRDRLFMRIGYTSVITKTRSEDARDLSGFVLSRSDISNAIDTATICTTNPSDPRVAGLNCARYDAQDGGTGITWDLFVRDRILRDGLDAEGVAGIGTPPGIRARSQKNIGTPTVSIGYWLDQERKWLLEGYVLAAPLKVNITGDGTNPSGQPNGINGKVIATTKLLPPLVIGSYNFGEANAMFRPYVGVGAMYAVFFGAKATPELERYVGGPTTITTKNTFGFGPFLGLKTAINEDWHINVSVGRIGLRAESRLVTSNTQIRSGDPVIADLTPGLSTAITEGDGILIGDGTVPASTLVNELVAFNKGQTSLGTFVREQKMKLTNTIITVSVGMDF